jgi:hypothetical protein
MKQNGWRGMMDGDGSHLSRMKSLLVFLCFVLRLVLLRLFFLYQWGLIPEWVKPAVERGGLFLFFLAFYVSLFSTMLSYCFLLYFVHIAFIADGR